MSFEPSDVAKEDGGLVMLHPMQPIEDDGTGVIRFKPNKLVAMLLEHGQRTGLGLNELSGAYSGVEYCDDWRQFAQLIGYSLGGFEELSYVDDITYKTADRMARAGESEYVAKIKVLEELLTTLRNGMRDPIAQLYQIHPDDLYGD